MLAVRQTAGVRDADVEGWASCVDESGKLSWACGGQGRLLGRDDPLAGFEG